MERGGNKMTKDNFEKMMTVFAQIYEKNVTVDLLHIYYRILQEIPDKEVDNVIEECLRRYSFFPKPADIIKAFDFVYDPLQTLE